MRNITVKQLRLLTAAARGGSFAAAAEACNVTPPAVTMQMRQLEADVGLPLFERDGRGLRLTAAGREILSAAEKVDAALADCAAGTGGPEIARRRAGGGRGRLHRQIFRAADAGRLRARASRHRYRAGHRQPRGHDRRLPRRPPRRRGDGPPARGRRGRKRADRRSPAGHHRAARASACREARARAARDRPRDAADARARLGHPPAGRAVS